jgi:2-hydroxychromene-2-carboxylate isomerase
MPDAIDFWFSTGSTYTYLTVSRLQQVEAATGVRFNWRPFSVRTLMREQNNIPFATKPIKTGYMWRDIERRAAMYGLKANVPAPYPLKEFDLANRLALLGLEEGWGKPYIEASYRRWFVDGQEPGLEPNLSASLEEAGQEAVRVVPLAGAKSIRRPPTRRAGSACSARRPSPSMANCSGATIASMMPCPGSSMGGSSHEPTLRRSEARPRRGQRHRHRGLEALLYRGAGLQDLRHLRR